jgi:hypothetical protein
MCIVEACQEAMTNPAHYIASPSPRCPQHARLSRGR